MRLVTYTDEAGAERVGLVEGTHLRVVDGSRSLLDLIRSGGNPAAAGTTVSLGAVRLLAPIPRPEANVICLGRNYHEHADEMVRAGRDRQDAPTFFTKAVTTVVGPYDPIPYDPSLTTQLDWEVELAVVIGRPARNVSRDRALDHVFGYMVLNDISARDLQYGHGGQFFYGKSLDGSCPTGPWLLTADEVPDPHNLPLRLRVNGETKQESSTALMIFDVPAIIELLSRAMTLLPGQIIATGTPPGVGYARTPAEFLRPGDLVESEIGGIGALRNPVQHVG
jgi:2-keto-4-pentenoate hydratase/2-oxohepta-3-ene-1,7-dioic acid hydratase in catechol pathway